MKKITKWHRLIMKMAMLFIPDGPYGDRARGRLYEPFLKNCGKNFKVAMNAFIYNPNGLTVGDNVYIGFCSYLGQGEIILADEVLIGNFVSITPSNHMSKSNSFRFGGYVSKSIHIGRGTWLAAHSCLLAGVSIGSCCLVAAGAVVTRSILENNCLIAGIPAHVKRKVCDGEESD